MIPPHLVGMDRTGHDEHLDSLKVKTSTNKRRPNIEDEPEDVVVSLITLSLYRLFGVKKIVLGTRTLKKFDGPSLIDIAPGVWNMRYLQVSLRRP
jgi:hypothetical protein